MCALFNRRVKCGLRRVLGTHTQSHEHMFTINNNNNSNNRITYISYLLVHVASAQHILTSQFMIAMCKYNPIGWFYSLAFTSITSKSTLFTMQCMYEYEFENESCIGIHPILLLCTRSRHMNVHVRRTGTRDVRCA